MNKISFKYIVKYYRRIYLIIELLNIHKKLAIKNTQIFLIEILKEKINFYIFLVPRI
jgi:hypothetical protein